MKGILKINGKELNVIHFTNDIYTETDVTGRPWGKPNGGVFSVVVAMQRDMGGITRAALHDTLQLKGELCFYHWDYYKVITKLEFANAYIVNYHENYSHNSTTGPLVTIVISPGIQRINNDVVFEKPWNIGNPFADEQTAIGPIKKELKPEIKDYFITDKSNKRIDKAKVGETILLHVNTKDMIGETMTINLDDQTVDFKYKGQRLVNDSLKDLVITSDAEIVALEVIKQENI